MEKHIPMRMCVSCREMKPQNELFRFVKDITDGNVKTDFDKKLFGRGAYICRTEECVKRAVKKRGLERHFRCAVSQELYETAEDSI